MSLVGCQINPIDVNFYLQKSLEIFDKNSVDKIWSNKPESFQPLKASQIFQYFKK